MGNDLASAAHRGPPPPAPAEPSRPAPGPSDEDKELLDRDILGDHALVLASISGCSAAAAAGGAHLLLEDPGAATVV